MRIISAGLFLLFMYLVMLLTWQPAHAHEMGTSALVLHEQQTGSGLFVFKRTVSADGKVPPIDFSFSPGCELRNIGTEWEEDTEVIQRGTFHCGTRLDKHRITATGFTRLSPELIVLATPMEGERIHKVLNPGNQELRFGREETDTAAIGHLPPYLLIGIEHIVFGLDHVLFVTGLYLLWRKRRQSTGQLFGQFTLFTVGHSLTLALLVLGWIAV
ncbi:MAG TPA: HupE/UreJ family protein, partial [Limnobacter sp.]|nr:HupE/UreJ family protein [Limnobacter sp.]